MLYQEPNALQIRVTLSEIEPAVWRRLIVPLTWDLRQLHLTIQAAFNWRNYHLHEFNIGGLRYGDPKMMDDGACDEDPRSFDERGVRLLDFGYEPAAVIGYIYDFGDGWRHVVEFEKRLALELTPKTAACVAGARARPPEDVGGVDGYERFLATMSDRNDPEHAETKRWCGGHFDPEWFDLELADKDLRNALKPNIRRRLHQPKPKRSSA
jgi:hypothetical protein